MNKLTFEENVSLVGLSDKLSVKLNLSIEHVYSNLYNGITRGTMLHLDNLIDIKDLNLDCKNCVFERIRSILV